MAIGAVAAFRAHFAVRARLAEDVAVDGLGANRRDYVIFGAGADTFAWRHPLAAVITMGSRPSCLAGVETSGPQTCQPRRVTQHPPGARGSRGDFLEDVALPHCATWNWLGVTQYLEKSATEATLGDRYQGLGHDMVVEFLLTDANCDALGAAFRRAQSKRASKQGNGW